MIKTKIPSNVLKTFQPIENKVSFYQGFIALFIRNIKIIWQYKFSLMMGFVNTMLVSSLFYYISMLVPNQMIEQDQYIVDSLSFIFAGVLLTELSTKILLKSMNSFTSEIKQGTFETLTTMSFGLKKYFLSEILFEVFFSIILSCVYFFPILFIFPVFKGLILTVESVFSLLLVIFCIIFFFFSLSLVAANFTILNKRGKEIAMVIIGIMHLLSGSFFPLSLFPEWLRYIAYLSPFTLGIRAFRLGLFGGADIRNSIIWIAVVVLIGVSFVLLFLFKLTYKKIYDRIRTVGTIHEF